jgi:hypothetical protein
MDANKPGFTTVKLPGNRVANVPEDIVIKLPENSPVTDDRLHLLAYIPWDDKYLAYIPDEYTDFFKFVVPHLGARTTDVHTALSVSHLAELMSLSNNQPIDKDVLYVSVILHDSGWPMMEPSEIADSLSYNSVEAYSPQAMKPKEMHATLGSYAAKKMLREYSGAPELSEAQQKFVRDLVYYHDQIRPWPEKPEPIEYLLLGDADRMWSYTHENFWLDTIRKNTEPAQYLENLRNALEDYFLTEQGRTIARRLVGERAQEVAKLTES